MVPPKKEQQQYNSQEISEIKVRPQSVAVNWNVLAGRTQIVAPVGAWVESAQEDGEDDGVAFATAIQIEKEYKEQQKEKEKLLKRFQEEVKRRVNQRIKLKRKQQLKTSYEAALKESSVVVGFSDSALQLTPKKNTCLFRYSTDSVIGNFDEKVIAVQLPSYTSEQFSEQSRTVSKTVQQVRQKLASRKAISEGNKSSGLPGGAWESLPRQKPEHYVTTALNIEEGDIGELPLRGFHDLPAELQWQKQGQEGKNWDCAEEFQKKNSEMLKSSSEVQAFRVLWPGIEKEESKKQRQSQYLRYRRLFMDIEREKVKEQQRQKEWQKKMDRVKKEKELWRRAEEQRIQAKEGRTQETAAQKDANPREKTCEKLQHLKLEDPEEEKKLVDRQQKNKEYSRLDCRPQKLMSQYRYVEALRAQMREKMDMYNIHLPPMCFCGSDFWDSHPDSCANNCMFYKNHKAYARALQTVISSCNVLDKGSDTRLPVHSFAAVHARTKNS